MSADLIAGLAGVERTALWTLHCRAAYAERGVLDDPEALRIRDEIGAGVLWRAFGPPAASFAHRARTFDVELDRFLRDRPGAFVVSLGEGLETQRYRVDGYGRWTTVDLPPVLEARARFIPPSPSHVHRPGSATDLGWLDDLGDGAGYVVAQGLFLYLEEADVRRIVRSLAARGNVGLMFDVVPRWVAALSRWRPPISPRLRVPRMPWGAGSGDLAAKTQGWAEAPVDVVLHRLGLPAGPFPGVWSTVAASVRF